MLLKEAIERNKNPNAYYEARLFQLLEEIEEVKREVKQTVKEAVQEIKEAKEDSIFKELQPTKELAKQIAKQEMATFKDDIKDQVKSVLETIKTKQEVAYEKIDGEIGGVEGRVEEKIAQFIEECRSQMAEMSEEHHTAIDGIVEKTKIAVGPKGEKGEDGRDGERGFFGADGKDADPNLVAEIVIEKIKKNKEELFINSIKGLEDELLLIKKMIREKRRERGGGGGSGNWTHETPSGSINGSNTDFTTTYNIASSGKALSVLLNGQMQRLTTHYTVSGKTITFTTAPETGDVVFIIYVRT